MKPRFAIGNSTFSNLRQQGSHFVDKSMLIAEVVSNHTEVLLLPRPRRFGKTLALTMLQAWFDHRDANGRPADHQALFNDLAVWQADAEVQQTFGDHPVVFLTFKDIKAAQWSDCRAAIELEIAAAIGRHATGIEALPLAAGDRALFETLRQRTATDAELWRSLKLLTGWIGAATGKTAVVLIDEYDTPIIAGWKNGYYDQVIGFFREFFSAGLKDNPHLYRGVLTGILRVAKESLFSGLNNLSVYTVLSEQCATRFGFTHAEVVELAQQCELADQLPGIVRWYNGYLFGGEVIYNPWSVLNFLTNPRDGLKPYWVNTASDDLLRELLVQRNTIGLDDWQTLLAGGVVRRQIDENMVLRGIEGNADAVWSLLLFSGYLKGSNVRLERRATMADLAVPNVEVNLALARLFDDYLQRGVGGSNRVAELCQALLAGDVQTLSRLLGELLKATLSYHDVARRPAEAVYQAFILGLLTALEASHEVTSNREAGYGRYDVMVSPRVQGHAGAVLELKVVEDGETAEQALQAAEQQLQQRDYAAGLRERGAQPVWQYAMVFEGKRALVRVV